MKSANGRFSTAQCVLIVDLYSIMGASMEKLLSSTGDFYIIGSTAQDENTLVQDVWRYMPEIIVFSDKSELEPFRLLSLLENYCSLRLIVVSEHDNALEIYEKRRIETKQRADFAKAICD